MEIIAIRKSPPFGEPNDPCLPPNGVIISEEELKYITPFSKDNRIVNSSNTLHRTFYPDPPLPPGSVLIHQQESLSRPSREGIVRASHSFDYHNLSVDPPIRENGVILHEEEISPRLNRSLDFDNRQLLKRRKHPHSHSVRRQKTKTTTTTTNANIPLPPPTSYQSHNNIESTHNNGVDSSSKKSSQSNRSSTESDKPQLIMSEKERRRISPIVEKAAKREKYADYLENLIVAASTNTHRGERSTQTLYKNRTNFFDKEDNNWFFEQLLSKLNSLQSKEKLKTTKTSELPHPYVFPARNESSSGTNDSHGMLLPGVERIIERRYYVKKPKMNDKKDQSTFRGNLSTSRQNSSSSSCSRCTPSYVEDLREKTSTVQNEVNQLKAEISKLQLTQATLLQQQRQRQQPTPFHQESTPSQFQANRYVPQTNRTSQATMSTDPATTSSFPQLSEKQQSQSRLRTPPKVPTRSLSRTESLKSNASSTARTVSSTSSNRSSVQTPQQKTIPVTKPASNEPDRRTNAYENQPYKRVDLSTPSLNGSLNGASGGKENTNSSKSSRQSLASDRTDSTKRSAQQSSVPPPAPPFPQQSSVPPPAPPFPQQSSVPPPAPPFPQHLNLSTQAPRSSPAASSLPVRPLSSSAISQSSSVPQAPPFRFPPASSNQSNINSRATSLTPLSPATHTSVQQSMLTPQNISRFSNPNTPPTQNIRPSNPSSLSNISSTTSNSATNINGMRNNQFQNNNIPQRNSSFTSAPRMPLTQGLRPNLQTQVPQNKFQTNQTAQFSTPKTNVDESRSSEYITTLHDVTPNEMRNLMQYSSRLNNFGSPRISAVVADPQTSQTFWDYVDSFIDNNHRPPITASEPTSNNIVNPQRYQNTLNRWTPMKNIPQTRQQNGDISAAPSALNSKNSPYFQTMSNSRRSPSETNKKDPLRLATLPPLPVSNNNNNQQKQFSAWSRSKSPSASVSSNKQLDIYDLEVRPKLLRNSIRPSSQQSINSQQRVKPISPLESISMSEVPSPSHSIDSPTNNGQDIEIIPKSKSFTPPGDATTAPFIMPPEVKSLPSSPVESTHSRSSSKPGRLRPSTSIDLADREVATLLTKE